MPGMATPAEINQLESLHGTALDIDFLQLMIRHHQGGMPMAQYAAEHAEAYVRDLAQAMVKAQSSEIIPMEQLLRQLGGIPLPARPEHRRATASRSGQPAALPAAVSRRRPGAPGRAGSPYPPRSRPSPCPGCSPGRGWPETCWHPSAVRPAVPRRFARRARRH